MTITTHAHQPNRGLLPFDGIEGKRHVELGTEHVIRGTGVRVACTENNFRRRKAKIPLESEKDESLAHRDGGCYRKSVCRSLPDDQRRDNGQCSDVFE